MKFIQPKNLQDALKECAKTLYPIIAGGTDLVAQWKVGVGRPAGVISVCGISGLKKIAAQDHLIKIGSIATHTDIIGSEIVQKYLPALVQACKTIGSVQIQNRGTIGGNVMNASPAGDTLPVLLAYETDVELAGIKGKRRVPFDKFYTGYRKTVVGAGEIITKFVIKKPVAGEYAEFIKIGTRQAQAISKVCACFRYNPRGRSMIAFGSVAPTPIRCPKTEAFLAGRKLDKETIESAAKLVQEEIAPIDDIRSDASYRRHICGILLKRFLIGQNNHLTY